MNIIPYYPMQNLKSYLVGGIPTPLKNMKVSWDYYSQYGKIIQMFQTTNQLTSLNVYTLIWFTPNG
jgi:hypothetical protein